MADIELTETNPIPLTAVVGTAAGGYVVGLDYDGTDVSSITDGFTQMPATVAVNVTSTGVPAGYHLAARGDGTWTATSSSQIVGVFTIVGEDPNYFDFTILVTDGTTLVRADPRLIVKKLGSP